MEDAHATILDLVADSNEPKPTKLDDRLSFFGVYDGHGGDKVALFAGEHIHQIISKQEAFKKGDLEQALKDGFLATDRAILNGQLACTRGSIALLTREPRSSIRRRGLRMYCFSWHHF